MQSNSSKRIELNTKFKHKLTKNFICDNAYKIQKDKIKIGIIILLIESFCINMFDEGRIFQELNDLCSKSKI